MAEENNKDSASALSYKEKANPNMSDAKKRRSQYMRMQVKAQSMRFHMKRQRRIKMMNTN